MFSALESLTKDLLIGGRHLALDAITSGSGRLALTLESIGVIRRVLRELSSSADDRAFCKSLVMAYYSTKAGVRRIAPSLQHEVVSRWPGLVAELEAEIKEATSEQEDGALSKRRRVQ
jgi:hypothetical protein